MSSLLDMSLDEIRNSKRGNKNSNRRNNRKSNSFSSKGINDHWKHDKYDDSDRRQILSRIGNRGKSGGSSILVSNLHWEVSENDLKELFKEVGEVSKVRIKYDKAGRSEGEATVVFNSKSDARRAIDKYNGVELDGMELKIEMDNSHSSRNKDKEDSGRSRGSILSRLGKGKGFKNRQNNNSRNNNRHSRRRNQKENVTKEMLDEEMDRYMSNEMDIEANGNDEGNGDVAASRNVVSYVDEDEPVKGDLNNA